MVVVATVVTHLGSKDGTFIHIHPFADVSITIAVWCLLTPAPPQTTVQYVTFTVHVYVAVQ
jgi:hypothetical protein